jgi:hypothetical protein
MKCDCLRQLVEMKRQLENVKLIKVFRELLTRETFEVVWMRVTSTHPHIKEVTIIPQHDGVKCTDAHRIDQDLINSFPDESGLRISKFTARGELILWKEVAVENLFGHSLDGPLGQNQHQDCYHKYQLSLRLLLMVAHSGLLSVLQKAVRGRLIEILLVVMNLVGRVESPKDA